MEDNEIEPLDWECINDDDYISSHNSCKDPGQ